MIDWFKAFIIMFKAHKGQKDKGGGAYFLHPLRVSLNIKDKRAKVIGLLHDVIEDSDKYKLSDFNFLDEEQVEALKTLTHDKSVHYFDYIDKIKKNPLARKVKLSDLKDNMNLKRLKEITEKDRERFAKYEKARKILLDAEEYNI
ncbi:GTP pyrophosphokinase [Fenollaria massiliensis]|uniref:GTP pyrophosphokinase n=1 Tax=Fenollaria massiliensis TaxID=938288 RepID=A0A9E7IVM3_9FIRM|nr:GTP pyrophosphokinase [Fenollaria massiliensis]UQK59708.1 GTP pyrophosphokinase [Fenollaria massiliensis]